MGWLCAAATAAVAAFVAGTTHAGTSVERGAGENAAFVPVSSGFLPVNAPVHRRCDFIRDPQCTGAWSPSARPNARRGATASTPGDVEASTPAGANVAAAGCPPGNVVGAKGECVAPKPLVNGCAPEDVVGVKGECVKPLPVTIPEPGTLPLAAVGFAALFALGRRRAAGRAR